MSTPYISTAIVGSAHSSDILGVTVCDLFTITCSSDGYLKFWENSSTERKIHFEQLVDKIGLHHVTYFQNAFDMKKILLIATVSFSGKAYIYQYDYDNDKLIDLKFNLIESGLKNKTSLWCPIFDTCKSGTIFACTTVSGSTKIFNINIEEGNENKINFQYKGELFSNDTSFATCISSDIKNNKIVIGHQNGNTYLYDFKQMVLSYNFETQGIKNSKSLNIIRDVKLSPNDCKYLAIASDSGPFGTISLYDVMYGEYLGSFKIATHSANVGIGNFAHSKWCMSIDFNKNGDKLVSCGFDNIIRIWDVESRTSLNLIHLNSTDMNDEDVDKLTDLDTSTCINVEFNDEGKFKDYGQNCGITVVGFDRCIRWFREAGGI